MSNALRFNNGVGITDVEAEAAISQVAKLGSPPSGFGGMSGSGNLLRSAGGATTQHHIGYFGNTCFIILNNGFTLLSRFAW